MREPKVYTWQQWRREAYNRMRPQVRDAAAAFVRQELEKQDVLRTAQLAIVVDPENWFDEVARELTKGAIGGRFLAGMSVRNALRQAGFSDAALGIDNLDDYFLTILEIGIFNDDRTQLVWFEETNAKGT